MTFSTENEVLAALAARFCAPEWAFLRHVADTTGGANRTADAMAMNLWRSRGLALHGFEVKVRRADMLKELKAPAKADKIARFCDYWWLVLGDRALLKEADMVPPTWGVMVPRGTGVVVQKQATKLDAEPLTRVFLAAILRRGVDQLMDGDEREAARVTGWKAGYAAAENGEEKDRSGRKKQNARDTERLEKLTAQVRAFEQASGVSLPAWGSNGARIGAAVRVVLNGTVERSIRDLEILDKKIAQVLAEVRAEKAENLNEQNTEE